VPRWTQNKWEMPLAIESWIIISPSMTVAQQAALLWQQSRQSVLSLRRTILCLLPHLVNYSWVELSKSMGRHCPHCSHGQQTFY
jgi:hypothetical protein